MPRVAKAKSPALKNSYDFGGMVLRSGKFVEFQGKIGDISIYSRNSNATIRRLVVMNDYILANPLFNDSNWCRLNDHLMRNQNWFNELGCTRFLIRHKDLRLEISSLLN